MKPYNLHKYLNKPSYYIVRNHDTYISDGGKIIFKEAVIRTNAYTEILRAVFNNALKDISEKNYKYLETMLKDINEYFIKYNIEFINEGIIDEDNYYAIYGINSMQYAPVNNKIAVLCNNSFDTNAKNSKQHKKLSDVFCDVVAHELVHRGQFLERRSTSLQQLINQEEAKAKKNQNKINASENPALEGVIGYLSNKNEIMAYASQALEELRFSGTPDSQTLKYLRNMSFPVGMSTIIDTYIEFFRKDGTEYKKILQRFFKYIYEYIVGDITDQLEVPK